MELGMRAGALLNTSRPLDSCCSVLRWLGLLQTVGLANESGNTALHWACLMGHEAVARLLLEAGASASALNM